MKGQQAIHSKDPISVTALINHLSSWQTLEYDMYWGFLLHMHMETCFACAERMNMHQDQSSNTHGCSMQQISCDLLATATALAVVSAVSPSAQHVMKRVRRFIITGSTILQCSILEFARVHCALAFLHRKLQGHLVLQAGG